MIVRRRWGLALIAAFALAVIAAGCGSSSNSGSTSTESKGEGGGETTENAKSVSALPEPTAKAPSGEPVVIADITDDTGIPGVGFNAFPEAEQVAVEYVNEYLGGVNGRPLKLWTCDSKVEAAATSACTNEALQQNPVAQVGISLNLAENGMKQLHENDVPTFNVPTVPAELSEEKSYPLNGGAATEYPAQGYWAGKVLEVDHLGILQPEEPSGRFFMEVIHDSAEEAGVGSFNESFYKQGGTDVTPAVAKALSGNPEFLMFTAPPPTALQILKAGEQQGYPAEKMMAEGNLAQAATLESAGSLAEGLEFTFEFKNYDDLSDPQIKTYRAAMEKFNSSVDARKEFSLWGFANVMTIAESLNKAGGEPTGKTLIDYMEKTPVIPIFGGNKLEKAAAKPSAPALWNNSVIVIRWNAEKDEFEEVSEGFFEPPPVKQ